MAKQYRLTGKKLLLVSITRQDIFDGFPICCDNCGATIINFAHVKSESDESYHIGLDCKKTLIDKPLIKKLKESDVWEDNYKAKEYTTEINTAAKFITLAGREDVDFNIDQKNNWIAIYDRLPHKQFEGFVGNSIFSENLGYMYKIGLKDFIQQLTDKAIKENRLK